MSINIPDKPLKTPHEVVIDILGRVNLNKIIIQLTQIGKSDFDWNVATIETQISDYYTTYKSDAWAHLTSEMKKELEADKKKALDYNKTEILRRYPTQNSDNPDLKAFFAEMTKYRDKNESIFYMILRWLGYPSLKSFGPYHSTEKQILDLQATLDRADQVAYPNPLDAKEKDPYFQTSQALGGKNITSSSAPPVISPHDACPLEFFGSSVRTKSMEDHKKQNGLKK